MQYVFHCWLVHHDNVVLIAWLLCADLQWEHVYHVDFWLVWCLSHNEDEAEDRLIWPAPHAHQLLILLEEFVQKTHGAIPNIKDFKVMAVKLLGPCAKRYLPAQVKSKYHRMRIIYGKFKKLINHTGFGWDFDTNVP